MNIRNFLKYRLAEIKLFVNRKRIILDDTSRKIQRNRVNLHYWKTTTSGDLQNLGDWLSLIVVREVLKLKKLSLDNPIDKTSNLFAIGSIIDSGFQDATIWGSGFFYVPKKFWYRFRKLDVRCVRGPLTRDILISLGFKCPEIYGDPALLLPLFYKPKERKEKADIVIIHHFSDLPEINSLNDLLCSTTTRYKVVNIMTNDWQETVDEIYNSKLVISSSLHGIILAEAYGIPAMLLKSKNINVGLFKFKDYYFSTGRQEFPMLDNVRDSTNFSPILPDRQIIEKSE